MDHLPPNSTRIATLYPDTTLARSALDHLAHELRGHAINGEEVEALVAVQSPLARSEQLHLARRSVAADLGDGEAVLIFVGQRADAFEEQRNVGMRQIGRASCRERVCQYV